MASVIPETVKKMRAFEKDPCIRKITTAGTRIILKSDKKLGMFMDQLLRYKTAIAQTNRHKGTEFRCL